MIPPRLAKSLVTLRDQINQRYPNRSLASDGWIGDAAHIAEGNASDHNPWYPPGIGGIVTAIDITHDPSHGVDINFLSDQLAASRDIRIKYLIANNELMDSRPMFQPWQWVPYTGGDPHTSHLHISVMDNSSCDDPRPWTFGQPIGAIDMQLTDTVVSELTGKPMQIGTLYAYWDKWIVENWRHTQDLDAKLDALNTKLDALIAAKKP